MLTVQLEQQKALQLAHLDHLQLEAEYLRRMLGRTEGRLEQEEEPQIGS